MHKAIACLIGLSLGAPLYATDLVTAYNQALTNDMTFRQAEAQYLSDQQNIPLARAALLPQLSGNANAIYSNNRTNLTSASPKTTSGWDYTYGLTLNQSIFNYSSWAGLAQAKASVKASAATYNAAAQSLISSTIGAYTTVLTDYEQLRVQKAEVAYDQQNLTANQEKYRVGLVAVTAVYQLQSKRDTDIATQITDQNKLSQDLEALRTITGHSYNRLKAIAGTIPARLPQPNNINLWVNRALQNSYDVKVAYYSAQAAKETVHADTGSLLPSVGTQTTFTRTQGRSGTPLITANQSSINNLTATATLSIPIFAGGKNFAQRSQDRQLYEKALSGLTFQQRTTASAARTNYLSLIADISSIKANKQAIFSSNEALKATEAGYRVGTKTLTDVLLQANTFYTSQQSYATAQYQYITDYIALKQNIGTLNVSDVRYINGLLKKTIQLPGTKMRQVTPPAHRRISHKTTVKIAKRKPHPHHTAYQHYATHSKGTPLAKRYYTIQLYAGGNLNASKQFAMNRAQKHDLSIVSHTQAGHTLYKVTRGWYTTRTGARAALKKLPRTYLRFKPWITRLSSTDKLLYGPAPTTPVTKRMPLTPQSSIKAKKAKQRPSVNKGTPGKPASTSTQSTPRVRGTQTPVPHSSMPQAPGNTPAAPSHQTSPINIPSAPGVNQSSPEKIPASLTNQTPATQQ